MYKQGGIQELVSEYYSYLFLKAMQFHVAEYRIKIIKSAETGLRACSVSFYVRIFKHDFVDDKEKIYRHTVVWQGFLTQSTA